MPTNFGPHTHSTTERDPNIYQTYDNTCAVRSQEIVMRDYGIQIPQDELVQYAKEHNWFDDGTPINCMHKLLNDCNIDTKIVENANIDNLVQELNAGHRVIVAVDAVEIWRNHGTIGNWIADHFVNPNHALIVTSLNVDFEDPSKTTVLLTDPGSGEIIECPYSRFAHSWGDSNCHMVATTAPAPYQYNPDTGLMEYSNFATEFAISKFPFNNEFSNINEISNENYEPVYDTNHLISYVDDWGADDTIVAFHDDYFVGIEGASCTLSADSHSQSFDFDDKNDMSLIQHPIEFDWSSIPQLDC